MTSARLQYPQRHRGLDHRWFEHQPTLKRPAVIWPNGKPVALWITVPVEFFPMDAPAQPFRPLGGIDRGYPDFWSYSNRDYGMRIGIYRIMRVLDRLALRATAAVNAAAVTRYPGVMAEIVARRWEVAANGIDMGRVHHGGLALDDERTMIRQARDVLKQSTGADIAGWYSPGHAQSQRTLQLVAESGFSYVTDWANDDMPYTVTTGGSPLCAMPLTYDWSDRVLLVQHNLTIEDYQAQVWQAFLRLRSEAERLSNGRILSLSLSPWVLGYPHRIGGLTRTLGKILDSAAIWPATGVEIVRAFKSQSPEWGTGVPITGGGHHG
jgi:allantoinase